MKIGVLTLPLSYNYGGILQAYALQTVLLRLGHDPKLIYYPFKREEVSFQIKVKRLIKKIFNKYPGYYIDYEERFNKWLPQIASQTNRFIHSNILLTNEIHHFDEISENDFDVIIVGSDQIWRPCMFQYNPTIPFLSFAKEWKIKRIAYAASFGMSTWEYSEDYTKQCAYLASLFDCITVREKSAVELCKQHLGVDASNVLDPTLLLDSSDYENLIIKSGIGTNEGTLFTYILDPTESKANIVNDIAQKRNLNPFKVNAIDGNVKCSLEERIARPVEAWIRGIADAEFVITDSFHACVFSIIFNKPFIVIGNKQRGLSRFESLLGQLGLMKRLVDEDYDFRIVNHDIDYLKVNKILMEQKTKSITLLSDALNNGNY